MVSHLHGRKGNLQFWGEVQNTKGEKKSAYLVTKETYTLTAITALNIAQKVLNKNFKTGFQTPSNAYGEALVMEVEGTKLVNL